jgi:hypothetical protein
MSYPWGLSVKSQLILAVRDVLASVWFEVEDYAAAAMRVRAIGANVIEEKVRSPLSRLARCHSCSARVSLVHISIAATRPVVGWLRRPAVVNMLDRITGGIFIALRRASRRGIERALR